jgi:hypothetical protein
MSPIVHFNVALRRVQVSGDAMMAYLRQRDQTEHRAREMSLMMKVRASYNGI